MIGLWWQYRGRPQMRDVARLSAPPVLAATLTAALTVVWFGVKAGFFRLLDVFVARRLTDEPRAAVIPGWLPVDQWQTSVDVIRDFAHSHRTQWLQPTKAGARVTRRASGCTAQLLEYATIQNPPREFRLWQGTVSFRLDRYHRSVESGFRCRPGALRQSGCRRDRQRKILLLLPMETP